MINTEEIDGKLYEQLEILIAAVPRSMERFIFNARVGTDRDTWSGAKTIKKNTNSIQNKSQTHRAKQYKVTSFLSTDCELSTETCSKNVYSLGPRSNWPDNINTTAIASCVLREQTNRLLKI